MAKYGGKKCKSDDDTQETSLLAKNSSQHSIDKQEEGDGTSALSSKPVLVRKEVCLPILFYKLWFLDWPNYLPCCKVQSYIAV